jgi:hypothetical protein
MTSGPHASSDLSEARPGRCSARWEATMFRRLQPIANAATIFFDDHPIPCQVGESVAAALLGAGVEVFRSTPVSGEDRMPYCMIGVCFDCLVEIDGLADRQACLVSVTHGMRVRSQLGTGRLHTT